MADNTDLLGYYRAMEPQSERQPEFVELRSRHGFGALVPELPAVNADSVPPPGATAPPPAPPGGGTGGRIDERESGEEWAGYSADRLMELLSDRPRIPRATTGLRARLGMKASRREQEFLANRDRMCVSFGEPVSVVVANPKGGAGKTPLALLLAAALGRARAGGVVALEDHELRGTMHLRLKPDPAIPTLALRTVRDLIGDIGHVPPERLTAADVGRYVRHQAAGHFDALVSAREAADQITRDEFERVSDLLGRFYSVTVVDTANNERAPAWRAAVERASVLVVVAKWSGDKMMPAIQMLEDLQSDPDLRPLVRHVVVVVSQNVGEGDPAARARFAPYLADLAAEVVEIAPDPHLASCGPIVYDQLTPATRRAVEQAGAAVCGAAQQVLGERRTLGPEREQQGGNGYA